MIAEVIEGGDVLINGGGLIRVSFV